MTVSPHCSTSIQVFSKVLGTLEGFKAKLFIDSHTHPIFCKARPVPYRIRPQVDSQIDKLLSQNILEPVPFSDWAAPIYCPRHET